MRLGYQKGKGSTSAAEGHGFIDIFSSRDLLLKQKRCLVQIRQEHSVHQKPRRVLSHDDLLAHGDPEGFGCLEGSVRGLEAGDDFKELHDWHRVEEVHPDNSARVIRPACDPRNRDRGGVGGQDWVLCAVLRKLLEDPLFQPLILTHCLFERCHIQLSTRLTSITKSASKTDSILAEYRIFFSIPAFYLPEIDPLWCWVSRTFS